MVKWIEEMGQAAAQLNKIAHPIAISLFSFFDLLYNLSSFGNFKFTAKIQIYFPDFKFRIVIQQKEIAFTKTFVKLCLH